jgi:hypothetical protein
MAAIKVLYENGRIKFAKEGGSIKVIGKPVFNANKGSFFHNIQSAITDADPGDLITVSPGEYLEGIYIDKPLTLRGPNYDKQGNDPNRKSEATIIYPSSLGNRNASLSVNSSYVTIEGFNFQYPDSLLSSGIREGSTFFSYAFNNLVIRNNRFYSSEIPIYIYFNSPFARRTGVVIEGNYIDCGPYVNSSFNRAIYCADASATIQDNYIVNSSIGIQLSQYTANVASTVRRNTVYSAVYALYNNAHYRGGSAVNWQQNKVGIAPNDRTGLKALVSSPLTANVNFGAIVLRTMTSSGSSTLPTTTFTNNDIDLYRDPAQTYNSTVLRGVWIFNNVPLNVTASINNNSIKNWTVAVRNEGTVSANLENNWWGTGVMGNVTRENTSTGVIDIDPIRSSGTDSDSNSIGFQP